MNTIKLEEIISYQEKTLNFLKLELEKAIKEEKSVNEAFEETLPDDDAGYQSQKEQDFINDKNAMAEDIN